MNSFIRYLSVFLLFGGMIVLDTTEFRTVLFQAPSEKPLVIQPGDSTQIALNFSDKNNPTTKMLRVIGGTQLPEDFNWYHNIRNWEYWIDDHLDSVNVVNDKNALLFRGSNDKFERKAYHRISGEYFESGQIEISLQLKRTDMIIHENGKFGIELEIFYKKDGRSENDIYDEPDTRLWMPVGSGHESDFTEIKQTFEFPEQVAAVVIVAGGNYFSGDCLMEAPVIKQNGEQIISIPFVPRAQRSSDFNYWTGVNLVSRNWPVWKVTIDDVEVFNGSVFDRSSVVSDFYIPLPDNVKAGSTLSLSLEDEPGVASFPYEVRGIELIEQPADDLEIISQPKFVTAGKEFGLLVETQQPDTPISIEATSGIEPVLKETALGEKGLHVIRFNALTPGTEEKINIQLNGKSKTLELEQILIKEDDHVYLSTGDEIYLDMKEPFYSHYFKWFIGNNLGNFYHFRPSYQWSGRRYSDSKLVRKYINLLNELEIPYAWQVEGRTLAGEHLNPSLEVLSSPIFHGKQAHENDGGYYYWRHFHYEGQISDMAARKRPYGGIFAKQRPIYTDSGTFVRYDPFFVKDMAHGAEYFVDNLKYSKGESTRHTGPSTMFRYLYQAGYEWLGAEQMYGPEETIMSSLRGASRAYGKTEYGSLHAMQWGSRPYTDPRHAHRFYLSLATAYMHGSSHINTEEALWIDEYANDRFSESGKLHIAGQQKIYDFIQTHKRRGQQVNDIALIQGRNCAWKSFGRTPIWSQREEKWEFNKATESFDFIKIFYPQNIINNSGPEGWFSSMPYGAIDLLPVEADQDLLNQYKTIIFLGWNTYDQRDWERLTEFVKNGGTLIFSAAHLNIELEPHLTPRFPENDETIHRLLGKNYRLLKEKQTISYGKGKVIYFPQSVYPADESIREPYREAIKREAEKVSKEQWTKGWINPDNKTSFTVWDEDNRRTIYVLNIDWSTSNNHSTAQFNLGDFVYEISPRSYFLETIHIDGNLGLMPMANTTDILAIETSPNGWLIEVQTTGADNLQLFRGDKQKSDTIFIAEPGVHNIEIEY